MVENFAELTGNMIPAGNVADYVFGPQTVMMPTVQTVPGISQDTTEVLEDMDSDSKWA